MLDELSSDVSYSAIASRSVLMNQPHMVSNGLLWRNPCETRSVLICRRKSVTGGSEGPVLPPGSGAQGPFTQGDGDFAQCGYRKQGDWLHCSPWELSGRGSGCPRT